MKIYKFLIAKVFYVPLLLYPCLNSYWIYYAYAPIIIIKKEKGKEKRKREREKVYF
jgi:hypothetical protein